MFYFYKDYEKRKKQMDTVLKEIDNRVNEFNKENENNKINTIILCGDFNCNYNENEVQMAIKNGYKSSFRSINPMYLNKNPVTHLNHEKEKVGVDFILYKNLVNDIINIKPIQSRIYPWNASIDVCCVFFSNCF